MTGNPEFRGRHARALTLGCALLLACGFPLRAAAEDSVTEKVSETIGDRYLLAGGSYEKPDKSRGVDSGVAYDYGYGRAWSERNGWELRAFSATLETGIPNATDYYQYGGGLNVIHAFGPRSGSHYFALAGVGGVHNDVSPDTLDGFSGYANLGFGWRSAPWSHWGLRTRLEVRGVYDTFDSGQTDFIGTFAIEIPTERVRTIERERVVEKIVEKEVIKEVIKEVPVAPVVTDRDGDGIPDDQDKCPETVAGAKVGPDGCVHQEQVVVIPNVEFEFAKAELTDAGKTTLQQVLKFLNDQKDIKLEVWGHTDDKGTDLYNLKLSQKRAASVVKFLTASGIDAARLNSAGFGESRPIADNTTDEGRARNRRVELHIRAPGAEGSR